MRHNRRDKWGRWAPNPPKHWIRFWLLPDSYPFSETAPPLFRLVA